MSVLLVDIGNTRVKWARFANGRLQKQRAAAHEGWQAEDFEERLVGRARGIERIIVASVGGARSAKYAATAASFSWGTSSNDAASAASGLMKPGWARSAR